MDSNDIKSSHLWRLFGFTFAITASYILCRAVAHAVLLSRLGTKSLPIMIILGAVTVGLVSFAWARRTQMQKLNKVILLTQSGAAFVTGCLFLLLKMYPESAVVIGGLYLLAEIRSCLNAILLALLLNHGGDAAGDKRPFAVVNAGAPLAGILTGILMSVLLGTEATVGPAPLLLLLCCGFDLIACLLISRSATVSKALISAHKQKSKAAANVAIQDNQSLNSGVAWLTFGKTILLMIVCKTTVLTFVDYEWKVLAAEHYCVSEEQLASYFGVFYAVSDTLTLILQLLVTRYFLKPQTMALGLYLLPVYLIVIGTVTLLTSDAMLLFWLMTIARGSLVIRRGVYDVIVQVLYGWLPRKSRRATVATILGVAKPIAEATTAVSILAFAALVPAQTLTGIWLPALLVWILVLKRLSKFFKRASQAKAGT